MKNLHSHCRSANPEVLFKLLHVGNCRLPCFLLFGHNWNFDLNLSRLDEVESFLAQRALMVELAERHRLPSDPERRQAGDIPFYQPNKFQLVINTKAAKALGLEISPNCLGGRRGDRIEWGLLLS